MTRVEFKKVANTKKAITPPAYKTKRMDVGDIVSFWTFCKYIILRPLQFSHEMVCDNRTGLVSSTKVGFTVALIVATIMLARLTETLISLTGKCEKDGAALVLPMVSLIRDSLFLYMATFAASSIGSKLIMSHYGSRDKETEGHEAEVAIDAGNPPRDPVGGKKPPPGTDDASGV